ncbi:hypothetical protein BC830DRAFT_1165115 [Chytriomyces sp. MP71]|nr:hypothetical protein BC830DRAFT_1165115 [Chytriomyces sp. MP71]
MTSRRIVSMLPSASEIVCLCGGEAELVGRSHEDDYPESIRHLPIVTRSTTVFTSSADVERQVMEALNTGKGMYTVEAETLLGLKPTAIVTQDLCHVCAIDLQTVERVAHKIDPIPHIITLNPLKFQDVIEDILRVGTELGYAEGAQRAVDALNVRISSATKRANELLSSAGNGVRPRVLFIEWTDPVYPGGHWTPQLVHMAGGTQTIPGYPVATDIIGAGPSVVVTHEACVESDPEVIVISPCGVNLEGAVKEADLIRDTPWFQQILKKGGVRVAVVDGNQMFNRPGPRLVDALEFLVGFVWDKESLIPAGFPYVKYV